MRTEIHAAVSGAGYWGANLLRVLHNTDGMWLKVVCDPRPEISQEVKTRYPEVAFTPSWDHILSDQSIAAVFLATLPATRYQLARAALTAGKRVWVEKPRASAYDEGQELVALARKTQRMLFVNETFLYDPLVQQALIQ